MHVHTMSGTIYEIDLDAKTVQRHLGEGSGELRRDGDAIPLVSMTLPTVGEPLRMILDLRGDGVQTLRTTSEVTKVES